MNAKLKLLATLCLALILGGEASAQIGERRDRLSIGGSAGMTFSSIDFEPTIKQKQLMCPTVGFTVRYACEKYFSTLCAIQGEVNLVKMGWKEEILSGSGEPLPDTYQRELTYVQIPLLARLSWGGERRGAMFFFMAGPQFSIFLNDKAKQSDEWTLTVGAIPDRPNNVVQQYDLEIQRKVDYGLTAGMGMEVNTAIGHFNIEGRYYLGLNYIFNILKKDPFSRSAHRTIVAKITYLFDIFDR